MPNNIYLKLKWVSTSHKRDGTDYWYDRTPYKTVCVQDAPEEDSKVETDITVLVFYYQY